MTLTPTRLCHRQKAGPVDEKLLLRGRSCGRSVAAVPKLLLRPGRSCCCGRGLESQDGPEYRHRGAEEPNVRPPQPQEQNKREKKGVTENPPRSGHAGWETAPASEAVAVDEKLLPGQSGPAASRGSINHHRSAGEHQPPKLPATGVQQYEPAEALQEGLQEA